MVIKNGTNSSLSSLLKVGQYDEGIKPLKNLDSQNVNFTNSQNPTHKKGAYVPRTIKILN
jgi:hypothetical protein